MIPREIPADLPDVPMWLGLLICLGPPVLFFLVLFLTHVWGSRRDWPDGQ